MIMHSHYTRLDNILSNREKEADKIGPDKHTRRYARTANRTLQSTGQDREIAQYIAYFDPDIGQTQVHITQISCTHTPQDSTIFSQIDEKDADKIGPDKLT